MMVSPRVERRVNCVALERSANGLNNKEAKLGKLNQEQLVVANKSCGQEVASMATTQTKPQPAATNTSMKQAKDQEATAAIAAKIAAAAAAAAEKDQKQPQRVGPVKKFILDCLLYLIKGIMSTYDLISWPVYFIKQGVARRRREVYHIRSKKVNPNDPNSPWRQIDIPELQKQLERQIDSYKTFDDMIRSSLEKYAPHPCYGYRQLLEEQWVKKPEGGDKLMRQVRMTDFKWCSFEQFDRQIEAARLAFLRDGVRAGHRVIVFADTRAEWQIVSQGLLRLGAIVCTMYSTLGVDGIIHTCNETKASLVITQYDKVERLLKLHDKLPDLKKIIYFDTSLYLPKELGGDEADDNYANKGQEEEVKKFECRAEAKIECVRFIKLLKSGLRREKNDDKLEEENRPTFDKRTKDSLAVIMYTSGSTGIPKGVLINHRNLMATVKSFSYVTKDFVANPRANVCTAYLPLAHIFEFCIEAVMLYHGVRYGFATPYTLTDKSPGVMPGGKGDLTLLRPTVMIIVPLVLDRIAQGVKQALKEGSYFKEQLVNYLIEYKSYWIQRHFETPLVDKIVCSKISQALGGRARWVICGSAPLSSQTHNFIRAALNIRLPQGFGTTETCAATACQLFCDQSTQNVGLPVAGAQIRLEPWLEGNYRPTDKPNPRGEIVVGGEMVAQGYFNLEEQTKEAFYIDEQGIRWYRTGDIGEFLPNGQLKIIDRKKDLVKLQNGEYISLGRVESTLKSNPYTENFCVYVNSNHNFIVALGPANEVTIRDLAQQIVDDYDRVLKLSPTTAKRQGLPNSLEERENLLLGSHEDELALLELREILSTYQIDSLNNNDTTSNVKFFQPQTNERLAQLCCNKLINDKVLMHITKMARERNLMSLEVPKKILLVPEEWTEDKNLVTAAMKIRRNYIYKRYERQLEQIYAAT